MFLFKDGNNLYQFINKFGFDIQGDYNYYGCGIKISNAQAEDSGEWSCDIEEYNRGGVRNTGAKVSTKQACLSYFLSICLK